MTSTHHIKQPHNPAKILAVGFLLIILLGAALLLLPFAAEKGIVITPLEALFTATSAVCVTGLVVVDTATSYSLFGEIVIIALIQIGGLGFMLLATSALVLLGRRITLRNRMLLHDTMSMPGLGGTVRTTLRFVLIVFCVEIIGAISLAFRFVPMYGWGQGLYYSIFHAISAFCNAGFDLFGTAGSLSKFRGDAHVLLTISFLIIIGGTGFAVLADMITNQFNTRKLNLHSKIVVLVTGVLLLTGTVFFAMAEWDNPHTLALGNPGPGVKLLNAWFQSVTSRTAGYFSIAQDGLRDASKVFGSLLMFIGASPASTGGGIKTTTLMVIVVLVRSVFQGKDDVNLFHKRLPLVIIRTALSIFLISLFLLVAGAIFMSLVEAEAGHSVIDLVYEETSALATVGLSSLGTWNLRHPSQVWLILLMYFGRVGPLTMLLSLTSKRAGTQQGIRYPEDQIIVG